MKNLFNFYFNKRPLHFGTGVSTVKLSAIFDILTFYSNVRILASHWASYHDTIDYSTLKPNLPPEIETFACMKSQSLINFLTGGKQHLKPEHFLTMAFINPEPLIGEMYESFDCKLPVQGEVIKVML